MNKYLSVFFAVNLIFIPFSAYAQDKNVILSDAKIEFITKKDIRLSEAESLVRQEKYIDALILLDEIIKQDVRTDEAYLLAAYSYIKLERKDKARQTIINALNLDKRNKAAHNYAGRLALMNKNISDAKNSLAAIRTICGGDDCAEYRDLMYRITETESQEE